MYWISLSTVHLQYFLLGRNACVLLELLIPDFLHYTGQILCCAWAHEVNYAEGKVNISNKHLFVRERLLMSFTTCFLGCLEENGKFWNFSFLPQLVIRMRTHSRGVRSLPQGIVLGERFSPDSRGAVCLPRVIMADDNNNPVKNQCLWCLWSFPKSQNSWNSWLFSVLTYRRTLAVNLYGE